MEEEAGWPNTKALGTGDGAVGGAELLLLFPNKVSAGAEVVVEEVVLGVGLLAIKEKAGLGAAVESALLCPKVNTGLGGSAVGSSLLSAGLPKVKVG